MENEFNFGYVLGVRYGDGYVNPKYIRLEAKDHDFVLAFSKAFTQIAKRSKDRDYKLWYYKKHDTYTVTGGNPRLSQWFLNLTQKTLEIILFNNKEISRGFLRGFFDSEGSNTGISILISSTKKWKLDLCRNLLQKHFNIRSKPVFALHQTTQFAPDGYDYWRLSIGTYYYQKKFIDEIGFNIKRKQNKPMKESTRGGGWLDDETKYIQDNWKIHFDKDLAEQINTKFGSIRTASSVAHKRQRLNLWREKGWNQLNLK